jgi:CheY-specific phosphatase CheX
MLNTIEKAAENFCIHQMGTPCIKEKTVIQSDNALISYIDIDTKENQYRIYLAQDQGFVQKVAQLFLDEDASDAETLQDMTLETTNLIVGSAKVIAQEAGKNFEIQTPHFEKQGKFDTSYDHAITMQLDNQNLTIAIKELNA